MGAYAEYLAVTAAAIARKPSNLSLEEAASVPVASQPALEGIFTHGHLEKGQTILIHRGAGAVGAYAEQLASRAGANVIATASGDDEAYLNSIGASRVIDYQEAQFEKVLREKVDVVFDLIGGDTQKPLTNVRGTHSDQALCSIIAFSLRAHDHALWAQIEAVVQQRSTGPATHLD
jgi:NADPH:quinone reductase-like Zn-dependent oxidoreductase